MLAAVVVYGVAQAFIIHQLGPVADDIFRLQTTIDFEQFVTIMESWSEADAALFERHFLFDFVHPLIYGTALCLGLAAAMNAARVDSRYDRWVWLPFVASGCDVAENACYLAFHSTLMAFEDASGLLLLFSMGNAFAIVKWAIAGVCLLAIATLWIMALAPKVRRKI
jgi:hypothetical protein